MLLGENIDQGISEYTEGVKPQGTKLVEFEKILGIDSGVIVELEETEVVAFRNGFESSVTFSAKIDNKDYKIRVVGDTRILRDRLIGHRQHPLVTIPSGSAILKIGEFAYIDFEGEGIKFEILNSEGIMIESNNTFWSQLRKRIPTRHPLSLNQKF